MTSSRVVLHLLSQTEGVVKSNRMTRLLLCRMSNSGQMHRGGSMRVPAFPAEIRPSSGTRETTLSVCRTQDSAAFGPPPSARLPCRRPNAETYFLSSFCTVGTIIGVLSLLGAMATNQNGTLYARRKSTCQAHSKEGKHCQNTCLHKDVHRLGTRFSCRLRARSRLAPT